MSVQQRVLELGPWFHNLEIDGVQTAPDHALGDYPTVKWKTFAHTFPDDLTGKSVLDIGCNAGFYSLEMRRRGARVVGIDPSERYLEQARFVAGYHGLEIDYRQLSVYDLPTLGEQFDIVLFMGVIYHLRYPLLALDLIGNGMVRELLVVQSMLRGSDAVEPTLADYPFKETAVFERPSFPRMYFVEHQYAGDPSNWWVPNRACLEAMLRSAGFVIVDHPEREVFCCRPAPVKPWRGGP